MLIGDILRLSRVQDYDCGNISNQRFRSLQARCCNGGFLGTWPPEWNPESGVWPLCTVPGESWGASQRRFKNSLTASGIAQSYPIGNADCRTVSKLSSLSRLRCPTQELGDLGYMLPLAKGSSNLQFTPPRRVS